MCSAENEKIKWFRYVPHAQRKEFEERGWHCVNEMEDSNHGQWSVLMIWTGEDEPE